MRAAFLKILSRDKDAGFSLWKGRSVLILFSIFLVFFFSWGFSACSAKRFLKQDEAFLVKNKMEFEGDVSFRTRRMLKQELYSLYKLKPNENFLWIPKEWFYYKLQDTAQSSKFTKRLRSWEMKQFGEKPALLDRELVERTTRAMKYYLQSKGFFKAEVSYHIDYSDKEGREAIVVYEIRPGPLYLVGNVRYEAVDSSLTKHVRILESSSLLQPGKPMEGALYQQEVSRITRYLRNQGYAYFQSRYISNLEADSSNQRVDLKLSILPPAEGQHHRLYKVGRIFVYPDYDPTAETLENRMDSLRPGVFFISKDGAYGIRPEVILELLSFHPGELYNQDKIDKTRRQLDKLGIFNFASIKEEPSPLAEDVLDFRIYLTRNKQFEIGGDLELNTSNNQLLGRRLFGVAGDLSFSNRNLFEKATHAVIRFNGGSDLSVQGLLNENEEAVNAIDIGGQVNMYFPRFTDFLGIWKAGHRLGLYSPSLYADLQEKADTRWDFSYNYLRQINFYTISSLNANFGFDFRRNNTRYLQLNHLGVNYLSPRVTVYFDTLILQKNPFLSRSFDKQLFTGFFFKEFNFAYNSLPNRFGESYFFKAGVEVSGLEVLGANALYNAFNKEPDRQFAVRLPKDTIDFSQYMRFEVSVGHHRQFNSRHAVALRAYAGLAFPVGYSQSVPYVKQFYVGGPQSIRAWLAREIGPGGYIDPLALNPDEKNPLLLYQTGDVKIEMNAEYRFEMLEIFGVEFEGALFLDVGNVYTLKYDSTRIYSQLLWTPKYNEKQQKVGDNLFRYMAVGSGVGLRIDVTYFILRFDLGLKLRNPYPSYIERNGQLEEVYWRDLSHWKRRDWPLMKQDLNLNLSLNYPF